MTITNDQTPENETLSQQEANDDATGAPFSESDGSSSEPEVAATTQTTEEALTEALGSPSAPPAEEVSAMSAEELLGDQGSAEGDDEDEDEEDEEESEPVESPYDRPGQWFVVHSYAGYENKVKSNLESRIASMNMEDSIYEVVIPMEDVVEFKNGKKVVVQKKVFPGYLLVRCHLEDASWQVIRNTPGVTGFVSGGSKPAPLSRHDVETFLQVKPEGEVTRSKTRPRLDFELGESVRVREGPFADFSGAIAEIDEDRLKVKVLVNIFGRETPVELDFNQIAKL